MMLPSFAVVALLALDAVLALPSFGAHDSALDIVGRHHGKRASLRRGKRCGPKTTSSLAAPTTTAKGAANVAKPSSTASNKPNPAKTSTSSASRTATKTPSPSPTKASKPKDEDKDDEKDAASAKKTANAPKSTADAPKPTANAFKALQALFPGAAVSNGRASSWSTAPGAPNHISLSDKAIGATNVMKLSHPVEKAPDGKEAMEVSFKKGAYDYQGPKGGFSLVAYGPDAVDLTTAREATFAYRIYFQEGFQWNKGGKLPGLIGGDSDGAAKSCNGGHKATNCFSTRMMWRKDGMGELYAYLPPGLKGNTGICDIKPRSHCNPAYGSSVGRGAFHFKAGGWTTVAQRVRLNTPGKNDGEIEIFVGGKSVIRASGLTLRKDDRGRIRASVLQSFFGGHDRSWASPRDQKIWFSDFSVAITERL